MDLEPIRIVVQFLIAFACGLAANILIPRQVPGKVVGLFGVGLVGVLIGDLGYRLLRQQVSSDIPVLHWSVQNIPIIPSIIGSAIVLYLLTSFLRWGRYGN